MANLKYLVKTVTHQNCIHDKVESRLYSGNVCYHRVQNFLNLPVSYLKICRLKILFYLLFYVGAKLGLSPYEKKTD
jgi:hypothetical protein